MPLAAAQSKGWASCYVQLHNIGPTEQGQLLYHSQASSIVGVTLIGFASINDLEEFMRSPEHKAITEDEV